MLTIPAKAKTDANGTLSLAVPTGIPDADVDVLIVIEPVRMAESPQDWPPGYFDLAGSLHDINLERPPQGELQDRLPLD